MISHKNLTKVRTGGRNEEEDKVKQTRKEEQEQVEGKGKQKRTRKWEKKEDEEIIRFNNQSNNQYLFIIKMFKQTQAQRE